jgi:hypothetical protein
MHLQLGELIIVMNIGDNMSQCPSSPWIAMADAHPKEEFSPAAHAVGLEGMENATSKPGCWRNIEISRTSITGWWLTYPSEK